MAGVDTDYKYPPGNWMARQLRLVNDNSAELLPPKTAASRRSYKKYDTNYNIDYKDNPDRDPNDYQKYFPPKRETVQDVLFSGGMDTAQMFMNWKIPTRILESPVKVDRSVSAMSSLRQEPPQIPQEAPKRVCRQTTLPNIQIGKENNNRPVTKAGVRRSHSMNLGTPAFSARSHREGDSASAVWSTQVRANNTTKRNIEKILRTNNYSAQVTSRVKKSLEPDARQFIDTWLENATEEDRRTALKFFATLDNNNLPETEKQVRIDGMLKMLKSGHKTRNTPTLQSKLRFLRLQDPGTRAKRWLHTTWHHLPPCPDRNPVENKSSMYLKAGQPVPHDFVIHPDWG